MAKCGAKLNILKCSKQTLSPFPQQSTLAVFRYLRLVVYLKQPCWPSSQVWTYLFSLVFYKYNPFLLLALNVVEGLRHWNDNSPPSPPFFELFFELFFEFFFELLTPILDTNGCTISNTISNTI
jgi:hypothetical protein